MGKRKVYLNDRPVGVLSYKRVEKIKGIRYITFDTEADIIDRLGKSILEETKFDNMCKEYYKNRHAKQSTY